MYRTYVVVIALIWFSTEVIVPGPEARLFRAEGPGTITEVENQKSGQ